MKKVYSLIIEDGIEAVTLEENEVLEEILNSLESISNLELMIFKYLY